MPPTTSPSPPTDFPPDIMTAALTKALETYDPHWLTAGLDGSYLRTVDGVMYAVLVGSDGSLLAVYRISRKRMNVRRADSWPRALAEELMANHRPGQRGLDAGESSRQRALPSIADDHIGVTAPAASQTHPDAGESLSSRSRRTTG